MTIAVFGGAFDPLHLGHEFIINYIASHEAVNELLLVPTGAPSHKKPCFFSNDIRLAMAQRVADGYEYVRVLDFECVRSGVSYTFDTLTYVQGLYPLQRLILVIGFDQLRQFHKWFRFNDILDMVTLWVIHRNEIEFVNYDQLALEFDSSKASIEFQSILPPAISSSDIRQLIESSDDISSYVSETVLNIIP